MQLTGIDLFSGTGGLSLAFERAGFEILLAIDSSEIAIENYNNNRKEERGVIEDIINVDLKFVEKFTKGERPNVILGGPPCSGLSVAGKRDILDPRNLLIDEFYRVVGEVRPDYFLMENVTGMKSMKRPDGKTLVTRWIMGKIREIGYDFKWATLRSHWYGSPQNRPRVFFLGWLPGMPAPRFPPKRTHSNAASTDLFGKKLPDYKTVRDAFASIPPGAPNQDLVYEFKREDYIEKVKKLGEGESVYPFKESHRRLWWDRPAFTIKENHGSIAIHPSETRMINLREMACLQDFPHDHEFTGKGGDVAVLIGNAVPILMGEAIARGIMKAVIKQRRAKRASRHLHAVK